MTIENFSKRGVTKVMWPLNIWLLNATIPKAVKSADFKFDSHVPWDSLNTTR